MLDRQRLEQGRHEREKAAVLAYCQRLREDPDLDPVFAEFVRKNGIVLEEPTASTELDHTPGGESVVDDLAPKLFNIEQAVADRYFLKIGVLHTWRVLGDSVQWDPVMKENMALLAGVVVPITAVDGESMVPSFLSSVTVTSGVAAHFINDWAQAVAWAREGGAGQGAELRSHIAWEARARAAMRDRVEMDPQVIHGEQVEREPARYSRHTLRLCRGVGPMKGTVCQIELFGGLIRARVRVANRRPCRGSTDEKVIQWGE